MNREDNKKRIPTARKLSARGCCFGGILLTRRAVMLGLPRASTQRCARDPKNRHPERPREGSCLEHGQDSSRSTARNDDHGLLTPLRWIGATKVATGHLLRARGHE